VTVILPNRIQWEARGAKLPAADVGRDLKDRSILDELVEGRRILEVMY